MKRKAKRAGWGEMTVHGLVWILIGIVLILCDLTLEFWGNKRVASENPGGVVTVLDGEVFHLITRSCEALGIASLIFGMFSLFIELPGLRNYFLDRMKELVIERDYLKNLSGEELEKLQLNVIRANFRDDEIGDKGSFLDFLYRDIYSYIGKPYRERVTLEIRYEKMGEDFFIAHDRMTYICRMSGGEIVPAILWQNDPDEIEEIRELKIVARYPKGYGPEEDVLIANLDKCNFNVRQKDGNMQQSGTAGDYLGKEFRVRRGESYDNVDQLKIIIEAVYVVRTRHFHYWLMSYPTKDFSLILKFPDSYQSQAATFINNEHVGVLTQERGYYSFFYNSWMIPQSGVAWRLIPVEEQKLGAPTMQDGESAQGGQR